MKLRRHHLTLSLGTLMITGSVALLAEQVYLQAKKRVAMTLIADAYSEYLSDGNPQPPWPWADFHPIARFEVLSGEKVTKDLIVLSGSSGASLAFGVGHADGTADPNEAGNCVLVGHQTMEFSFLQEVRLGDVFRLSQATSAPQEYEVVQLEIVNASDLSPMTHHGLDELTLITCYPFGGLRKAKQRFIVHCRPIAEDRVSA